MNRRQTRSRSTVRIRVWTLAALVAFGLGGFLWAQDQGDTFAEVNGAKHWYEIQGSGDPLILLPGGPGLSHTYFTPHFSRLSDNYSVVYWDPYGRGKSDRATSRDEYSLQRDVEDLEGLRKALGFEKLHLFGHSYGGILAQAYVLKYPERVGKLILANTLFNSTMYQAGIDNLNHQIQTQHPAVWEQMQQVRERGQKSSNGEFLMALMSAGMPLAYFFNPANASGLAGDQLSFNPEVLFALAGDDLGFEAGGDMGSFDFSDQLAGITAPTLVIAGRFDRLVYPHYSVQFKTLMPGATFVMFEQSGHFPFIEEPDKMLETLESFLGN